MAGPRELWVVYEDTGEKELVVDGVPTDRHILDMYYSIFGRESDAWVMHTVDLLPDWWRLVSKVQVRNLTEHRGRSAKPHDDAVTRWEGASPRERVTMQRGWRVVRGRDGGGHHIFRRVPTPPTDSTYVVSMPIVEELEGGIIELPPITPSRLIIPSQELIIA